MISFIIQHIMCGWASVHHLFAITKMVGAEFVCHRLSYHENKETRASNTFESCKLEAKGLMNSCPCEILLTQKVDAFSCLVSCLQNFGPKTKSLQIFLKELCALDAFIRLTICNFFVSASGWWWIRTLDDCRKYQMMSNKSIWFSVLKSLGRPLLLTLYF